MHEHTRTEGIVAGCVIAVLIFVIFAVSMQNRESKPEVVKAREVQQLHQGLKCPKCGGDMEYGFVIDRGHGSNVYISAWQRGSEQEEGVVKAPNPRPIASFCCVKCGYIESYTTK